MDVEKRVASLPQLLDHRRAPRQIRDEVAVHDVDVQRVGPGVHDLCGNQPVSLRIANLDAIESKLDFPHRPMTRAASPAMSDKSQANKLGAILLSKGLALNAAMIKPGWFVILWAFF